MKRSVWFVLTASAWVGIGAAQSTVVPSDVQMPGTQPGEVNELESPNKCDNCHGGYDPLVEPTHNWSGGMMAQATRDPLFWATVAIAEQDFSGSGDLCLRCHSTEGWIGGRSTPTDGSGLKQSDASGVMCDACHNMANPDGLEHPGVQFAPFEAHDGGAPPTGYHGSGMYVFTGLNQKLGPYDDADSPHPAAQSVFHRSSAFCGTCHDVSNPVVGDLAPDNGAQVPLPAGSYSGVPGGPVGQKAAFNAFPHQYGVVERTYSEHVASAFPTTPVGAFGGLPPELQRGAIERAWTLADAAVPGGDYFDGSTRYFTCQSCHVPPVQGKGCNKPSVAPREDLPLHDMTGGNVWVPQAIQFLDARNDLVLGGGLSSDEVSALDDGVARALASLQRAAALDVQGDTVRVVNLTGHKLLSGYPEGRRMWLNVRWYDAAGALVREDGAYGTLTVQLDGAPTLVETILDLDDPHLSIYEAHMGISQEWASALVGLGWPTGLALSYDRVTGGVERTLGELANDAPGSAHESFHFVLNDRVLSDERIPPYGFRYDDAVARNILPVPANQYGSPGPGGTFLHYDEVPLDPPAEATRARIRLLYQTTSWEYVQFLHLANDGSVSFLSDTGEHLLEAWQSTGMAAPVEMATARWRRVIRQAPEPQAISG